MNSNNENNFLKIDLILREQFLVKHWQAYPAKPANCRVWGRFLEIKNTSGQAQLTLFKLGADFFEENEWLTIPFNDSSEIWSQILIPGDLIAVQSDERLVLLAPNLKPLEVTSKERFIENINKMKKDWLLWELWGVYFKAVKLFFENKSFLEVTTPIIVSHPGPEPTLDPFVINLKKNSKSLERYLPTSPELNIKKLLSSGVNRVFEVTKSFRNNEFSEKHLPEFWILEWYRNGEDLEVIKQDIKELIHFVSCSLNEFLKKRGISDFQVNKPKEIEETSFKSIFHKIYDFNFYPETDFQKLQDFCIQQKIEYRGVQTLEDLFAVVTLEKIETTFLSENLIFLQQYPPYAAALAKRDSEGWALRFEAYWQGFELANAFCELNDYQEQLKRFARDNELKKIYGLNQIPPDELFLKYLQAGTPPAAGVALGLERLFMAILGIRDIETVVMQPHWE